MEVITAIIAAISSGSPLVIITGFILLVFLIALPTLYKFWSTESTQLTLYSQLSVYLFHLTFSLVPLEYPLVSR